MLSWPITFTTDVPNDVLSLCLWWCPFNDYVTLFRLGADVELEEELAPVLDDNGCGASLIGM